MLLIGSREVLALTGLSANQLREWTVRRALVQSDVPAQNRGNEAKFSWQTVLLLQLAVVLRTRFHVELQVHRDLLVAARKLLKGASFPALWGTSLAIYDLRRCELLSGRKALPVEEDVILLRLDRHLETLSGKFGLAVFAPQLSLFPPIPVHSDSDVRRLVQGGRR